MQGSLLAVGSNGAGLSPPSVIAVAPRGIPTGLTEDVVPGILSGDVEPIAGRFGVSAVNWAKLVLQPKRKSLLPQSISTALIPPLFGVVTTIRREDFAARLMLRSCWIICVICDAGSFLAKGGRLLRDEPP